jgi:hypothetical protein
MPDNANAPGTAPVSGGSPATTGAAAPADAPSLKQVLESVKALSETFSKKSQEWDNLRSLHDRQMTAITQQLSGKAGGRTRQEDEGGEAAAQPAAGGGRTISARELAMQRDNAILRFRQETPDWQEYWQEIENIGSDAAKARPFVRYTTDPETGELVPDFYASLVDIRNHLELQRHRAAKSGSDPASRQAAQNSSQARADAAAIGGAAASIPPDALGPDYQKLPYNEKIKRLHAAGLLDVDPNDLPEALRGE